MKSISLSPNVLRLFVQGRIHQSARERKDWTCDLAVCQLLLEPFLTGVAIQSLPLLTPPRRVPRMAEPAVRPESASQFPNIVQTRLCPIRTSLKRHVTL